MLPIIQCRLIGNIPVTVAIVGIRPVARSRQRMSSPERRPKEKEDERCTGSHSLLGSDDNGLAVLWVTERYMQCAQKCWNVGSDISHLTPHKVKNMP